MKYLTAQTIGNMAMLAFTLVTVFSSILIHETNREIQPILSAFYTFIFCVLIYNILSRGLFKKVDVVFKSWFEIAMLNVTTAVCWIFTFLALKYIKPELYLFMYLCAMPISSSLLLKTQLLKAVAAFTTLIFLVLTYDGPFLLLGVALAFLGGVSGTIYSMYAKKVAHDLTSLEILSLRFILTVILTFLVTWYFSFFQLMDLNYYLRFAVLSLFSVILPLSLFQIGIKNLNLTKALAYLPIAPLLCYAINIYSGTTILNVPQLTVVIILGVIMSFQYK